MSSRPENRQMVFLDLFSARKWNNTFAEIAKFHLTWWTFVFEPLSQYSNQTERRSRLRESETNAGDYGCGLDCPKNRQSKDNSTWDVKKGWEGKLW